MSSYYSLNLEAIRADWYGDEDEALHNRLKVVLREINTPVVFDSVWEGEDRCFYAEGTGSGDKEVDFQNFIVNLSNELGPEVIVEFRVYRDNMEMEVNGAYKAGEKVGDSLLDWSPPVG